MAVFDANVVAALFLDLPWSTEARRRFAEDDDPAAPAFMLVEAANVLWSNVRAGVLSHDGATGVLRAIPSGFRLEPDQPLLEPALEASLAAGHPIYDCLYLSLSERERTPLVTADKKLAAIARKRGGETVLLRP